MEGWRVKLPEWSEMIGETTFVEKKAMKAFFPDSQIYIERLSGLPKSYIAVKN